MSDLAVDGPHVKVISGPDQGSTFAVGSLLRIGRDPTNDLQLRDTKSSRRHAAIERQGENFVVCDLGSRNGTWLNERSIRTASLKDGDRIYIGDTIIEFIMPRSADVEQQDSITGGTTGGGLTLVLRAGEEDAVAGALRGQTLEVSRVALLQSKDDEGDIEKLRQLNERLRKLYEVNQVLSSLMPLSDLLDRILEIVFEFLPAERGLILLKEPDKGFTPVAGRTREDGSAEEIPISGTLLKKVITEKVALLSGDVLQDSRLDPSESIVIQGITSCLTVPMVHREVVLGVIHLDTQGSYAAFAEDDLEIVTAIATQAAVAVENARLLQKVEQTAVARDNLSRYLGPELVEAVMTGESDFAMEGSVNEATILFADIRGFTSLSERIPPQLVVKLLNEYFEIMVDIILERGGVVDKFVGDEIMAVWGVPTPAENDAFNAVSAAIKMQQALCMYNEERARMEEEPIYMGIGINTGTVVAGNLGSSKRMQYTVIGDAVNLASRMEGLTTREQILMSQSTFDLVKDKVHTIDRGQVSVKGKQDAVQVFEVKGLQDTRTAELGRTHERVKTAMPVRCVRVASHQLFQAVLLDISPGGAGIRYSLEVVKDLKMGEKLILGFVSPGEQKILIKGEVVRIVDPKARRKDVRVFGMKFVEVPPNIQEVIEKVLLKGGSADLSPEDA